LITTRKSGYNTGPGKGIYYENNKLRKVFIFTKKIRKNRTAHITHQ
jgi:hypothetical protein